VSSEHHKKTHQKVFGNQTDERFISALKKAQSWSKKYATAEEIPDD